MPRFSRRRFTARRRYTPRRRYARRVYGARRRTGRRRYGARAPTRPATSTFRRPGLSINQHHLVAVRRALRAARA